MTTPVFTTAPSPGRGRFPPSHPMLTLLLRFALIKRICVIIIPLSRPLVSAIVNQRPESQLCFWVFILKMSL